MERWSPTQILDQAKCAKFSGTSERQASSMQKDRDARERHDPALVELTTSKVTDK